MIRFIVSSYLFDYICHHGEHPCRSGVLTPGTFGDALCPIACLPLPCPIDTVRFGPPFRRHVQCRQSSLSSQTPLLRNFCTCFSSFNSDTKFAPWRVTACTSSLLCRAPRPEVPVSRRGRGLRSSLLASFAFRSVECLTPVAVRV